jgi:hypothetical protein
MMQPHNIVDILVNRAIIKTVEETQLTTKGDKDHGTERN